MILTKIIRAEQIFGSFLSWDYLLEETHICTTTFTYMVGRDMSETDPLSWLLTVVVKVVLKSKSIWSWSYLYIMDVMNHQSLMN